MTVVIEEVSADARVRQAVAIVAQHLVASAVLDHGDGEAWELYPELPEFLWRWVEKAAEESAPLPDREAYYAAYELLASYATEGDL